MRIRLTRFLDVHGLRILRYCGVSAVGVTIGQTLLYTFHSILEWGAGTANVTAVVLATIPSYLLNRAWVWRKTGAHHLTGEVLPFWGMALLGLLLSTVAANWAAANLDNKLWVNVANLSAFGVLWVAKYVVLDRYLFTMEVAEPATPVESAI